MFDAMLYVAIIFYIKYIKCYYVIVFIWQKRKAYWSDSYLNTFLNTNWVFMRTLHNT